VSRPAVAVAALGALLVTAAGATADTWGERGAEALIAAKAKPPKPGVYRGKVGTFARISFRVRVRQLRRLAAGVNAACQRASDGAITHFELLAIRLSGKSLRIGRRGGAWRFSGKGQQPSGVSWQIRGRFTRPGLARGTFQASYFRFLFPYDSELCSGSGRFTARRK
jgi:hypothetical protein